MATSAATSQPAPTTSADLASVTKKPSFTAADVDPLLLYASLLDQRYLQKLRPMMSDRLGLNEVEPQPAKKSSRGWGSARNNSKQQTRDEKASPQAAEHYRTSLKESLMCLEQFMRTDGAEKSSVSVPFAFEDFIDGLEQEQAVRRQLAAVLNPGSSNQLSASESVSSVPLSLPQVLQTPSKPTRDTTSRKASRQVVGSAVRKSTRLKRATPERVATAKRSGNARSGAQEQPTPSKTSRKRKQPSPNATPKSKAGARTTRSGRLIDPAHPAGSFENGESGEGDEDTGPAAASPSITLLDVWQTALGLDDDAFQLLRARIAQSCLEHEAREQQQRKDRSAAQPRQFDVAVERVDCRYDVSIVPRARGEEVVHAASKRGEEN